MTTSARRGRRHPTPDVGTGDGLDRRASRPDEPAREDVIDLDPGEVRDPQDVPDADPESVARTIVLRQLTVTARTRSELEKTLAKRAVPDDVAARVLDRMTAVGLVDDAAYAREWVRIRHAERGLARRALAAELRRKGIDDELARAALDTLDSDDELARARALVERKAVTLRGQPDDVRLRRLAGMLARKGYSPSVSYAVVRDVLGDLDVGEGAAPLG